MSEDSRLKNLGINIKVARLRRCVSQEKLAEMVGISRNSVSLIETGKLHPTILKVVDIAKSLDIEIGQLLENLG